MFEEIIFYAPFRCKAEVTAVCNGHNFLCPDCNSVGCPSSPCHVPVSRWRCYPKKYQNKV